NASDSSPKTRLFALALGSDANHSLLQELTRKCKGYFAEARETEDISIQLKIIFARMGSQTIDELQFTASDQENLSHVYQTQASHGFDGSIVAFVGRYKTPSPNVEVKIGGRAGDLPVAVSRRASLPELEEAHAHLPRLWARARVD